MCLQCLAESELVVDSLLPGWHLVRATKTVFDWRAGVYALVRINDPDFILNSLDHMTIAPDSTIGMSDDNIDNMSSNDYDKHCRFLDTADKLRDDLYCDPNTGHALICSCIESGYNVENDGRIEFWLLDRIARHIEEKKNTSIF